MSAIISDDQTPVLHQGSTSARTSDPTSEAITALPTLILLVPCLFAGIWLLISN